MLGRDIPFLAAAGSTQRPEMRAVLSLVLLSYVLGVGGTGCRHDCSLSGPPRAYFSVSSCCGGGVHYYWDDEAKDCVELEAMGPGNCGCICDGKDCERLYFSLSDCRREYAHCR